MKKRDKKSKPRRLDNQQKIEIKADYTNPCNPHELKICISRCSILLSIGTLTKEEAISNLNLYFAKFGPFFGFKRLHRFI